MPKNNSGNESPDTFFYDLIANPQAPAPSNMSLEQADFVRLTVDTEQAASAEGKALDFKQLWQQTLHRAEEIQSGDGLAGTDLPEKVEVLPVSIKITKNRPVRPSWPLTLVAGLVLLVVTGMLIFLAIQVQQTGTNPTSLVGSPSSTKTSPTATPAPAPTPTFNGLDLPYPGATSLTTPSDLWFRNYPAALVQNRSQFAYAVADKPDKLLAYYRQKLAGQTDYVEDRPANSEQAYAGLVAFKGSSLLVINALDATNRDTFKDAPPFFKLFRQMSSGQTLLIITYGTAPALPDLPDLSFAGSTNIPNIDIKNWPTLFQAFGAYDTNVVIRPNLTTFATPTDFVQVVNNFKLKLLTNGYEIYYETYDAGAKTCENDCQKYDWDVLIASKDARTILIRIYGPKGRDAFEPAELQKLTAQGLNSGDTLVSYRTGYLTNYSTTPLPHPDMSTASLAMASNASYLAVSKGNEVQLWKNGVALSTILDNFQSPPYQMAWSPDSQTLAIASGTGIQFWSASTGQLTLYGSSHTARVRTLIWSPNSKTLASAAGCQTDASNTCDERVLLWQPNGSLVAILPGHKGSPNAVLWSPDGSQLATEQNDFAGANVGTVRIWNPQGKLLQTLAAHPVYADSIAWLPTANSTTLATGPTPGTPNPAVTLWDTTSAKVVTTFPVASTTNPTHMAWSPNGATLAVTSGKDVDLFSYVGVSLVKVLSGHTAPVTALNWSADGKFLATGSEDATVKIWDSQGNPFQTIPGASAPFVVVSWAPKSAVLYGLTSDNKVWLADPTNSNGAFTEFSPPDITADRIAWFPGSDNFVTYSGDGYLTVWDSLFRSISTFYP